MNDFKTDDAFGTQEYKHLIEAFCKGISHDGRYVVFNKGRLADLIQKQHKTDIAIQKSPDESAGIEHKVIRWPQKKGYPHTAFFLETRSCTNPGRESDGWMKKCKADYLLIAFEIKEMDQVVGLDVYLINFPMLQTIFWDVYYPDSRYPFSTQQDHNRTEGKLVNITQVVNDLPGTQRFWLKLDGKYKQIKHGIDIQSALFKQKLDGLIDTIDSISLAEEEEETCSQYLDPAMQAAEEEAARRYDLQLSEEWGMCLFCEHEFISETSYGICPQCYSKDRLREFDRWQSACTKARRSNLPVALTLPDWLTILSECTGRCAYCRVEWFQFIYMEDETAGLRKGNVVPICRVCQEHKKSGWMQANDRVHKYLKYGVPLFNAIEQDDYQPGDH